LPTNFDGRESSGKKKTDDSLTKNSAENSQSQELDAGEATILTKVGGQLIGETMKRAASHGQQKITADQLAENQLNHFSAPESQNTSMDATRNSRDLKPDEIFTLEIMDSEAKGQMFAFEDRLSVGRGQVDVILKDASISNYHCTLRVQKGVVAVLDNGSSNGTYVDGRRIRPGHMVILNLNDTFLIGKVPVKLTIQERANPALSFPAGMLSTRKQKEEAAKALAGPEETNPTSVQKVKNFFSRGKKDQDVDSDYTDYPTSHPKEQEGRSKIKLTTVTDMEVPNLAGDADLAKSESTNTFAARMTQLFHQTKSLTPDEPDEKNNSENNVSSLSNQADDKRARAHQTDITEMEHQELIVDAKDENERQKKDPSFNRDLTLSKIDLSKKLVVNLPEQGTKSLKKNKSNKLQNENTTIDHFASHTGNNPIPVGKVKRIRPKISIQTASVFDRTFAMIFDGLFLVLIYKFFATDGNAETFAIKNIQQNILTILNEHQVYEKLQNTLDPLISQYISAQYQWQSVITPSLWNALIPQVMLLALIQIAPSILFGLSLGQWCAGLSVEGWFLINRLFGPIRVVLGFLTFPFLIFDLPILWKRRSFKEIVTFSTIVHASDVRRKFGFFMVFPFLILTLTNSEFIYHQFKRLDKGIGFSEKEILSAVLIENAIPPEVTKNSLKFQGTLPIKKTDFLFMPRFSLNINEQKDKNTKITLLDMFHMTSESKMTLEAKRYIKWDVLLSEVKMKNPFFCQQNSALCENIFQSKQFSLEGHQEFLLFLKSALQITEKNFYTYLSKTWGILDGLNVLQDYLHRSLLVSNSQTNFQIIQSGTTPILLIQGIDQRSIIFIPLASIRSPVLELSWSNTVEEIENSKKPEIEKTAELKQLLAYFLKSSTWSATSSESAEGHSSRPLKEEDWHLMALLDFYGLDAKQYSNDLEIFDKIFFYYYDAGRRALKLDNVFLAKELEGNINQLIALHEKVYQKPFDDYVVNMKKIIQALKEGNRSYFELPISIDQ
jgi:pSer/pThr/pTyr-binding forkhead associated (FHA) protein